MHEGVVRNSFLSEKGREENLLELRQGVVGGHKDRERGSPILPAGVLFPSYCERAFPNVYGACALLRAFSVTRLTSAGS